MRTSAGPSVSANIGAWIERRIAIVMVIMAIFVKSPLCSLIFGYWWNFPQFGQYSSVLLVAVGLQSGQCSGGLDFLNAFSVTTSRTSVPRNIRAVAPKVWNTWSASISPKWKPIVRMVVSRIMFNAMISGIPATIMTSLFHNLPLVM